MSRTPTRVGEPSNTVKFLRLHLRGAGLVNGQIRDVAAVQRDVEVQTERVGRVLFPPTAREPAKPAMRKP